MTVIYSIYFPASSYLVLFYLQLSRGNNHDCLGVMQSLYYKSPSKHVSKSVRHRNLEREKDTD